VRWGVLMRSAEEFDEVRRLIAAGMNDCQIARQTGVPRTTVRDWRRRPPKAPRIDCHHQYATFPAQAYSYLLGMYLGDGYISKLRRVWLLRITLDSGYPAIIDECCAAINAMMPNQRAHVRKRSYNCCDVSLSSKHWPCLLPQHGPGRKHNRPIVLQPWQQALVRQAPEDFIRGLIHSDGCRVVANDRGVASIRYHFSNRSDDIHGLFCGALDQLGIPWTRSSPYIVSIYRKAAVARLDEFVGPKC
jgi:hypothetical protein